MCATDLLFALRLGPPGPISVSSVYLSMELCDIQHRLHGIA